MTQIDRYYSQHPHPNNWQTLILMKNQHFNTIFCKNNEKWKSGFLKLGYLNYYLIVIRIFHNCSSFDGRTVAIKSKPRLFFDILKFSRDLDLDYSYRVNSLEEKRVPQIKTSRISLNYWNSEKSWSHEGLNRWGMLDFVICLKNCLSSFASKPGKFNCHYVMKNTDYLPQKIKFCANRLLKQLFCTLFSKYKVWKFSRG